MSVYADTNFLVALYLNLPQPDARSLARTLLSQDSKPFPVTTLLRLETRNALHRMAFESRHGSTPYRVTDEVVSVALLDFSTDLEEGEWITPLNMSWEDIEPQFTTLADRHTAKHGFRTYDIIHVASALHMRCTRFLSFDKNAIKLARLEGLQTD
jgi:predicted nucleic acid-binding protein